MSGFARKDEVVAFKITEMDSIATTTAGCTATRAYCVPQELTHAVIARLWHEAFDDAKTELSRPGAQHLDLSCRATFACDDGACDDVRPGSKYDPYQIPYRTDCGSFSTFSHDPKRSDNQLPARPPQPDYYSPTGQMIHKQRLVAILNQCPAMKSKDRLQRIAKVNVG